MQIHHSFHAANVLWFILCTAVLINLIASVESKAMIWLYNLVYRSNAFCEVKPSKVLLVNLWNFLWKMPSAYFSLHPSATPSITLSSSSSVTLSAIWKRWYSTYYLFTIPRYTLYIYCFMILFGRFICVFINLYTFNEIHLRLN